ILIETIYYQFFNGPLNGLLNEQRLIEEKVEYEKQNNFVMVIQIKYLLMLNKRLHAINDLPLNFILADVLERLDIFYK
ncbi:unnamed protein product, partial [Didymodactylos carnosus]